METTYRYIEDETVALDDGSDFTGAILRNCQITYGGGSLRIEGALFYACTFLAQGKGEDFTILQETIFRSLYAQGHRTIAFRADGTYEAL